ncbi:MAG TPA: VWA domain-containing protein [Myxococcota bacterium]|nr:VWA domain-containing protein [Myxococcota bacterium]
MELDFTHLLDTTLVFARPWALWLLLLVPLAAALSIGGGRTDHSRGRRVLTAAFRIFIIVLVALAAAEPRMELRRDRVALVFVVDHSDSIDDKELKWAGKYVGDAAAGLMPNDMAGVVVFGEHATIAVPVDKMGVDTAGRAEALGDAAGERSDTVGRDHSDLAGAVRLALAASPSGITTRLVLLSDGNEDRGDLAEAATAAQIAGVELHAAAPPDASLKAEVEALALTMSTDQADPGETVKGELRLHSVGKAKGKVEIYRNGEKIAEKAVDLEPGVSPPIDFEYKLATDAEEGTDIYEATFVPEEGDTDVRNNRGLAAVRVGGPPRALIATGKAGSEKFLKTALESAEVAVDVVGLDDATGAAPFRSKLDKLGDYDIVFMNDMPAKTKAGTVLGDDDLEKIATYVRDGGGGLVMLGGEGSFGPGGYEDTEIEKILPVKLEKEKKIEDVGVAVMVVLDISGSMNVLVGTKTRIWLADSGAVAAMKALKPDDYFGVLAVDTHPYLVVPLQHPQPALEPMIMKITAAGSGIYIYSALERARNELMKIDARIKHVIVFSDATDAEEMCKGMDYPPGGMTSCPAGVPTAYGLAASMYASGIATSVVGLGVAKDSDVHALYDLARAGHGKAYLTNNARDLPKIFVDETKRVASSEIKDKEIAVKLVKDTAITKGIDFGKAPKLRGYVATKIRPTADLALTTPDDEPVLASWRYGLGTVVAFTSDASDRWGANWLAWDGFRQLWAQVARTAAKKGSKLFASADVVVEKGKAKVTLDVARGGGPFSGAEGIKAIVRKVKPGERPEDAAKVEVTLRPVAPGKYEGEVSAEGVGYYLAEIRALKKGESTGKDKGAKGPPGGTGAPGTGAPGSAVPGVAAPGTADTSGPAAYAAATVAYSEEYSHRASASGILLHAAGVTGGEFPAKAETVVKHPDEPKKRVTDLWPWLLLAALLLVPFDLLLRRTGRWFGRLKTA